jgi:hypothetical protein
MVSAMRIFIVMLFSIGSISLFSQIDRIKVRKSEGKPKCSATLIGLPGGKISMIQLSRCNKIEIEGPCDYKVVSYLLSLVVKNNIKEYKSDGDGINTFARVNLLSLQPGDKFFIEKILVQSNITQQIFSLPSLNFRVTP